MSRHSKSTWSGGQNPTCYLHFERFRVVGELDSIHLICYKILNLFLYHAPFELCFGLKYFPSHIHKILLEIFFQLADDMWQSGFLKYDYDLSTHEKWPKEDWEGSLALLHQKFKFKKLKSQHKILAYYKKQVYKNVKNQPSKGKKPKANTWMICCLHVGDHTIKCNATYHY